MAHDVSDLVRQQPRVDRDQHATGARDAEVGLEQLRHVRSEEGDTVAAPDPVPLQRDREPTRALAQLAPRQPPLAVDDADPVREGGRRPLEERDGRQPRQVELLSDGVL